MPGLFCVLGVAFVGQSAAKVRFEPTVPDAAPRPNDRLPRESELVVSIEA